MGRYKNAYYNALHYADAQIGRLVLFLKAQRIDDRTLLVIVGDHGEAFGESGVVAHAGSPVEAAIRVGLVLNCPGNVRQDRRTDVVRAVDVAPTILGRLGIPAPAAFQGVDVLQEHRSGEFSIAFVHCCSAVESTDAIVTSAGWKYVFDHLRQRGALRYLPTDPFEQRDLSMANDVIAQMLHETLFEWRRRQLLYYSTPVYFQLYYAPEEPKLLSRQWQELFNGSEAPAQEQIR